VARRHSAAYQVISGILYEQYTEDEEKKHCPPLKDYCQPPWGGTWLPGPGIWDAERRRLGDDWAGIPPGWNIAFTLSGPACQRRGVDDDSASESEQLAGSGSWSRTVTGPRQTLRTASYHVFDPRRVTAENPMAPVIRGKGKLDILIILCIG
jgi:hypothetical protein